MDSKLERIAEYLLWEIEKEWETVGYSKWLEALSQAHNTIRERIPKQAGLLEALQTLAAYCNGKLGKNPYCIPEYKQALVAIGKATGKPTDGSKWMDANNETYTAMQARQNKGGNAQ